MSVELAVRRARRVPRLRPGRIALVALISGALVLGAVQPSFAGEAPSQGTESPRIEGFGLGDGLEGLIDPRDGAVRLTIPVAGLSLTWDSRLVGSARDGLPHGWGWGFGRVRTDGGVRMSTASGEWLDLSEEWTSGLAGYDLADRTFRREPGTLPPRADGVLVDGDAASREVEFVLRELGGTTTYYGPTGDPLAQVSATGERLDWAWSAGDKPRLLGVVSADGVVTRLDWSTGKVEIGVAAGHAEGDAASPWVIRFDADGVRSVTDPEQGIVHVRSDVGGLVSELEGVTGATTSFTWRSAPADGVPGVAELATTDRDGARLSTRTWSALDGASASGWPVTDPLVGMVGSGGHRTVLSDGASSVTSTYDARQRLTERAVDVSTASGTQRIQEHAFEYEDRSALRPGVSPRDVAARPTRSEVTFRDAGGATRTVTEEFRIDAFGRVVSRTAADGTTSTVKYDDEQPDPHVPPMGLPLEHRVVAPDGSTTLTVAALTPNRTATAATERYAGPSEDELESTGRTEFEVREDGFVTEQRQLPAGGEPALVTRWSETTDLARGEVTVTETVGVGTDAEASSSHTTSVVHGGLVRQTDPLGNAVTHAFDGIGRQISSTDAIGRTVHVEYETAQRDGRNAVTTTAPDGVTVTEVSDVLGRVTEVTDNTRDGKTADGHARLIESRDYREPGVVRVTDAWGATTVAREDALGRPLEAIGPNGAVLRTAYDDVANTVTSGLTPTGSLADAEFVTTQVRDASGRVTEQTSERADDVPGPSMTTEFDGFGRPTTTRSAGAETAVRYDELGNPVTTTVTPTDGERADGTTRGAPVVAERRFDPYGASLEKTLSDGTTSRSGGSRTLDPLGRTVDEHDQADGTTHTEYTIDGRVASSTDASGRVTEFEYEDTTRNLVLSRVTPAVGDPVTTAYDYDPVTGRPTSVYDPDDRRTTEITTTYDDHGNVLTTRYPDGAQIEYGYDEHGRQEWTRDALGNTTTLAFDDAGLLVSATQTDRKGAPLAHVEYEYDWAGRLTVLSRDNGVTTRYTHTSASQIATEVTTDEQGTSSEREYEYDATGQLVERVDAIRGDDGELHETTTVYGYDHLGRLIESTVHDGPTSADVVSNRTEYTLNVSGDLVAERIVTGIGTADERAVEHTYDHSARGELTSRSTDHGDGTVTTDTAEFDADGNLVVALDGTRYTYDATGRRSGTTSPSGAHTETEYWIDGTRKQLSTTGTDGPVATRFYWSGIELVNEVTPNGDEPATDGASYLMGADRHARTVHTGAEAETAYYGTDRHGSVTDLTDADGTVLERYSYTDYGQPIVATGELADAAPAASAAVTSAGEPRAVIGDVTRNAIGYSGEYHDEDRLQHLNDRDYDTVTKRMTTVDPVSHHNDYAYADGNPITRVDPTGRTSSIDAVSVSFAVLGAVLAAVGLVTGGLALTPYGIAIAALNAVDTAIAITEVVNVAGTPFLSEGAAAGLAAVGFLTGAATFAAGIRTAARKAAKAATAVADAPYQEMDDAAAVGSRVSDDVPGTGGAAAVGDGPSALPAPVQAPISKELAKIIELGGGTQTGTMRQLTWKFEGLLSDRVEDLDDARRMNAQITQFAPALTEYALRGSQRPFVKMKQTAGGRVPMSLWDALEAGSGSLPGEVYRAGLSRPVVALIRKFTVQYEDFRFTGQALFKRMHDKLQKSNVYFGGKSHKGVMHTEESLAELRAGLEGASSINGNHGVVANVESQLVLRYESELLRQSLLGEY